MTCTCPCSCPLAAGDQIRSTHISVYGGRETRTNGACPHWLAYISDEWAVIRYYTQSNLDGSYKYLNEKVYPRREFDQDFERDPRREPEPVGAEPQYPKSEYAKDEEW